MTKSESLPIGSVFLRGLLVASAAAGLALGSMALGGSAEASVTFEQVGDDIEGTSAGDRSGAVSLSGDGNRVAIGAPGNDDGGPGAGQVRVFGLDTTTSVWNQVGGDIVGAPGVPDFGSAFGGAVSLSADGNRIAVGAQTVGAADGSGPGQVSVFDWDGNGWVRVGDAIDGEQEGAFGRSVALSADGTRVAGGAPVYPCTPGCVVAGYAAVFESGVPTPAWSLVGPLYVGEESEQMGTSVSLSADGSRLAVSSQLRAQVFEWVTATSTWVQQGSDLVDAGRVDLSDNGNRVAVAARRPGGERAVRMFDWNEADSTWVQLGSDLEGPVEGVEFAAAMALSGDGKRIAVGAPGAAQPIGAEPTGEDPGQVVLYDWDAGKAQWVQVGVALDGEAAYDRFGESVALSTDGSRLAVGAPGNDGNGTESGHVRLYDVDGGSAVQPTTTVNSVDVTLPETGGGGAGVLAAVACGLVCLGALLLARSRSGLGFRR